MRTEDEPGKRLSAVGSPGFALGVGEGGIDMV